MRKMCMALSLALAITACEGPTGPEGPQGPGGSLNRFVATATIMNDGGAEVRLPAAAGANSANPPGLDCFLSTSPGSGVWISVADGDFDVAPYCGLVLTGGSWVAVMNSAPAGLTALFIATW